MSELGFYHPDRGYWQAIAGIPDELLPTYPQGTVEVPLKPGGNYEWDGSAWQEQPEEEPAAPEESAVDKLTAFLNANPDVAALIDGE